MSKSATLLCVVLFIVKIIARLADDRLRPSDGCLGKVYLWYEKNDIFEMLSFHLKHRLMTIVYLRVRNICDRHIVFGGQVYYVTFTKLVVAQELYFLYFKIISE